MTVATYTRRNGALSGLRCKVIFLAGRAYDYFACLTRIVDGGFSAG